MTSPRFAITNPVKKLEVDGKRDVQVRFSDELVAKILAWMEANPAEALQGGKGFHRISGTFSPLGDKEIPLSYPSQFTSYAIQEHKAANKAENAKAARPGFKPTHEVLGGPGTTVEMKVLGERNNRSLQPGTRVFAHIESGTAFAQLEDGTAGMVNSMSLLPIIESPKPEPKAAVEPESLGQYVVSAGVSQVPVLRDPLLSSHQVAMIENEAEVVVSKWKQDDNGRVWGYLPAYKGWLPEDVLVNISDDDPTFESLYGVPEAPDPATEVSEIVFRPAAPPPPIVVGSPDDDEERTDAELLAMVRQQYAGIPELGFDPNPVTLAENTQPIVTTNKSPARSPKKRGFWDKLQEKAEGFVVFAAVELLVVTMSLYLLVTASLIVTAAVAVAGTITAFFAADVWVHLIHPRRKADPDDPRGFNWLKGKRMVAAFVLASIVAAFAFKGIVWHSDWSLLVGFLVPYGLFSIAGALSKRRRAIEIPPALGRTVGALSGLLLGWAFVNDSYGARIPISVILLLVASLIVAQVTWVRAVMIITALAFALAFVVIFVAYPLFDEGGSEKIDSWAQGHKAINAFWNAEIIPVSSWHGWIRDRYDDLVGEDETPPSEVQPAGQSPAEEPTLNPTPTSRWH